jgi:FMN phosphatase YigB (HAD superfamily)
MTAVRIERSDRDEDEERDDVYDARVSTLAELADWIRAR